MNVLNQQLCEHNQNQGKRYGTRVGGPLLARWFDTISIRINDKVRVRWDKVVSIIHYYMPPYPKKWSHIPCRRHKCHIISWVVGDGNDFHCLFKLNKIPRNCKSAVTHGWVDGRTPRVLHWPWELEGTRCGRPLTQRCVTMSEMYNTRDVTLPEYKYIATQLSWKFDRISFLCDTGFVMSAYHSTAVRIIFHHHDFDYLRITEYTQLFWASTGNMITTKQQFILRISSGILLANFYLYCDRMTCRSDRQPMRLYIHGSQLICFGPDFSD